MLYTIMTQKSSVDQTLTLRGESPFIVRVETETFKRQGAEQHHGAEVAI